MGSENEKGVTKVTAGITECCGYDFGTDWFTNINIKFCPVCGSRILNDRRKDYEDKAKEYI